MYRKTGIPVLGVVQNMASFHCPSCSHTTHVFGEGGAAGLAVELGVPLLGSVPLHPALMASGDSGRPLVLTHPDSEVARVYGLIAEAVLAGLQQTSH
jgi:ATP-binding protein involved in chromosome partitioning